MADIKRKTTAEDFSLGTKQLQNKKAGPNNRLAKLFLFLIFESFKNSGGFWKDLYTFDRLHISAPIIFSSNLFS